MSVGKSGILVTGAPRTGTTWVGKMLAGDTRYEYLHEPFNNQFTTNLFNEEPFPHWFMFISECNEKDYVDKIARIISVKKTLYKSLAKVRNRKELFELVCDVKRGAFGPFITLKPLVKDPIAIFSSDWLASRFNLDVVMMIRHPAAFVTSIVKLGWNAEAFELIKQEGLRKTHLAPLVDEIQYYHRCGSEIEKAAMLWKCIYYVANKFGDRNKEWIFVRHEDIAASPLDQFQTLYKKLGLKFSRRSRNLIVENSTILNPSIPKHHWQIKRNSLENINRWRDELDDSHLSSIKKIVNDVSLVFYDDSEW